MKKTLLVVVAGTLFFACNRTTDTTQTTRTSVADEKPATLSPDEEMCFRQVSGGQKRDTAWVHLNIKNAKVTGTYWNLPFEKDSRRGTLRGTKNKDVITATWTFMQEGQTDSLPVQFRVTPNTLQQKPYSYHPSTGREYLVDSAEFTLVYEKLDCE
ncbi:hypothetical protein [Adhaeribacter rhizoryzae]|uniref:Lipoprotein n=1 Tax=Adhaeribacter rhizoryzae TaxID=2607907 RepID=A0A5M6DNT1_9BACT|nr:hypothetical protein [Adhaeribacter rhizoryzae]KAA5549144.1 hypothetical protein F0145_00675 [Adhaeribacter rhizoryzae]